MHIFPYSHKRVGCFTIEEQRIAVRVYWPRCNNFSSRMWTYCNICVQCVIAIAICDMNEFFRSKANHNTVISNHNSIVSFPFSGTQYRGNGPAHYCQYQTVGHRRLYRLQFPLTEGTIGLYMTINIRIGTSMVLCTRFEHQGFGGGG